MHPMRAATGWSRAAFLAVLAAGALVLPDLHAQSEPRRIRVEIRAEPRHWLVGQTTDVTPDSVYLVPERSRDTLGLARSDLRRIEVSKGIHSSAGVGALVGAGILGAAGIALTTSSACEGYCASPGTGFAVGAVAGAAAGGLIGAFIHHEKWQETALNVKVSRKGRRGVGVGVTVPF
jgi:hypothetical protein